MQGKLREFGPRIWTCEGPVVGFCGLAYPTRMVLIELTNGGLFVWSPVALDPALKQEVDARGQVRCLVSPNLLHHLFLGEWKSAYPDARLFAPPGLRRRRKDLVFETDLGDTADPLWAIDMDQVLVRGSFAMTEVAFFHRLSQTAIFADLIQNFPGDWFAGWRGILARMGGIVAPNPGAPIDWRASFVNRRAARAALDHILAWPIQRVLIAHGDVATTDGQAFVSRAFRWLNKGHEKPSPPQRGCAMRRP